MPILIDQSCRGKLAELNEKVTHLERQMEFLEASINGAANQAAVLVPGEIVSQPGVQASVAQAPQT